MDATTPKKTLLAPLNNRSPAINSVVKLVPLPVTVSELLEVLIVPVLFTLIVIVPVLLTSDAIVPVWVVPSAPMATPGVKVTRLEAVNPLLASKATFASALSDDRLTLITKPV